jgi:hypothetical protein
MLAWLFVFLGVLVLPTVAVWTWRMQRRVVRSLIPGADFGDVTSAADLPVIVTLQGSPAAEDGPLMHLLVVTREAASLFIAYRPVAAAAATAKTLLLDLASAGRREFKVLTRWQVLRTPLVVRPDLVTRSVAIQEPRTRLTVTLPLLG